MNKKLLQATVCAVGIVLLWASIIHLHEQYKWDELATISDEHGLAVASTVRGAWRKIENEMQVRQIGELPVYETAEEMRDYFLKKHPNADGYEVYTPREDAEHNFLPIVVTENFYLVKENGEVFGYFERGEHTYVVSCKDEVLNYVEKVSGTVWEYHSPIVEWHRYEDKVTWNNYNEWIAEAVLYMEDGESLLVKTAPVVGYDEEKVSGKILQVEVYKNGTELPFQVFETEDTSFYQSHEIYFTDFNMDGYEDLHIMLNYSPQHGGDWYYIWSPSQGKFVRSPEELDSRYMAIPAMRRFATHQNVSANGQEIWYYQWENEMDYRLLMWYKREYRYDENLESYTVKYYDKEGQETLLLDCMVAINSWEGEIVESLIDIDMDIVDQKTLQEKQNGEVFYVYMTRSNAPFKEEGKDYIYVINESMYPINMLVVESGCAIEDFGLEDLLGKTYL